MKRQRNTGQIIEDELIDGTLTDESIKTREQALQGIAGRMGGRPVSEKELMQYPGYRSLPTQQGIQKGQTEALEQSRKQEMHEADIGLKRAKATRTYQLARTLSSSPNKRKEVNDIKDFNTLAKLEITTKEALKEIPKYLDADETEINEEWIDMKDLLDTVVERRKGLNKQGEVEEFSDKVKTFAEEINKKVESALPGRITDDSKKAKLIGKKSLDDKDKIKQTVIAEELYNFASSNNVPIDQNRILKKLADGETVEAILDAILEFRTQLEQNTVNKNGQ